MPIPDFQTCMLPLLKRLADGEPHRIQDLVAELADGFRLSPEERKKLLPSGADLLFRNRVRWARFYLGKAGLVADPKRAYAQITQRGREALKSARERIDVGFLRQYPEFVEFRRRTAGVQPDAAPVAGANRSASVADETPEESLERAHETLRQGLEGDLLAKIVGSAPAFFERIVLDLLVAMGYGGSRREAAEQVGGSGDGGIDGTIKEDRLGLDVVYVQAKRWEDPVGRPELQKFAGTRAGGRTSVGRRRRRARGRSRASPAGPDAGRVPGSRAGPA